VHVDNAADAFTVTWCAVRGFDSVQTVTAQVALRGDGTIEMRYGDRIELLNAIVGLSPGRTGRFVTADLGAGAAAAAGGEALGERFAERIELDLVAVARRFYESHADLYDQLVIWTDARVTREAFAYEINVANHVRGLGLALFDQARAFGSGGRLRSLVVMDAIGKYPEDPFQVFLGENHTLALVAHETGHQWLAFLQLRDYAGRTSEALLGRDRAHWSFFNDSDGSVLEGNDIDDLGGGQFRTVGAVNRYSALDQYAMGLRSEAEVPPFFYVEAPTNIRPSREAGSSPQVGVTFDGTRRDVLVQDIVAVEGPRLPAAAESPRVHRQAFIYVLSSGRVLDGGTVQRLERIRRAWESFYGEAVERRGRVETRLRP
jgi:large repetitive protein